jgi:hypothetical protein
VRFRKHLTYSNVISTLCLFLLLGGGAAVAAGGLGKNTVGTKQLKPNAVTAAKIKNGAVNGRKIGSGAVTAAKLAANSVASGALQDGSVIAAKLAKNSVTNAAITNGTVGTGKLGSKVVTAAKLADGAVGTAALANDSVTPGKLVPEFGPVLGTLKSGQTVRGTFDLGGEAKIARDGESFQFPLLNAPAAPEANIVAADKPTTACPGVSGGNGATPQAAPGQLCVYVLSTSAEFKGLSFDTGTVSRLGFGLRAEFETTTPGDRFVQGLWAVTAP